MTKHKYLTNQQLLKELEQRLPNFTQEEFVALLYYLQKHQKEVMEIIKLGNPKIYDWCYEKASQLEQEKTDEKVEKIKKSLETKPKESPEKAIFNCQECQAPIKLSPPKKESRQILEFYGKWTRKGHTLVCQKCLEKK